MKKNICKTADVALRLTIIVIALIKVICKNYDGLGILLVTFILSFYDVILKNVFKLELSYISKIMITIFIFLAQILGSILHLYDRIALWDIILHFLSGILMFLIGLEVYHNICKNSKKIDNPILKVGFAICFAFAIGNIWEIIEFCIDGVFDADMQKTGELVGRYAIIDTMSDLISSSVGTLICFVLYLIKHRLIERKDLNGKRRKEM